MSNFKEKMILKFSPKVIAPKVFLFLLIGLLFTSCGSESNDAVTKEEIKGKTPLVTPPDPMNVEEVEPDTSTPVKNNDDLVLSEVFKEVILPEGRGSLKNLDIKPNDSNIEYEGRMITNNDYKEMYWSGSSIAIDFDGVSVKATFEDIKANTNVVNTEFNIFIDGKFDRVLTLVDGKKTYELVSNLSDNIKHSLKLTKRNQWTSAKTKFYGFDISGRNLFPKEQKDLFIEFYGDSITVGLGNEDLTGNDKITNNYKSYAAITARSLNAEYSCIARGGLGLRVSWFNLILPEMYDFHNPYNKSQRWDFSQKQANIVVINILQNDSWLLNRPDNAEYKRRFGSTKPTNRGYTDAYESFIKTIQSKYPSAKIICMLGNMDITKTNSAWPERVKNVVSRFSTNVYYVESPFIDTNGLGHPKEAEHIKSAEILTKFIRNIIL